jgi:hypothetical protein
MTSFGPVVAGHVGLTYGADFSGSEGEAHIAELTAMIAGCPR